MDAARENVRRVEVVSLRRRDFIMSLNNRDTPWDKVKIGDGSRAAIAHAYGGEVQVSEKATRDNWQ